MNARPTRRLRPLALAGVLAVGLVPLGTLATASAGTSDPVAVDDVFFVKHNTTFTLKAPGGVLSNDFDPQDERITSVRRDSAQHGTAKVSFDGSITYTPQKGFVGTDSFTYEVQDASGHVSAPATVRLVVEPDVTPTLLIDSASPSILAGPDGRSGTFPLIVTDSDAPAGTLTALSATSSNSALVANGGVAFGLGDGGGRTVTISPVKGATGSAVVTVVASDGEASRALQIGVQVGGGGKDTLVGTGGSDLLVGNDGGDTLDGGPGRDVLLGGGGDDVMTGGTGRDAFAGGAGLNTFKDFTTGQDVQQ